MLLFTAHIRNSSWLTLKFDSLVKTKAIIASLMPCLKKRQMFFLVLFLRALCAISLHSIFLCSVFKEEEFFPGGGNPTSAMICRDPNRNLEDKLISIREEILLSALMQMLHMLFKHSNHVQFAIKKDAVFYRVIFFL